MRRHIIAAAIMAIMLCTGTLAALSKQIDNGSIKVTIKDNIVTLKFRNENGELQEIKFNKDDYHHYKNLLPGKDGGPDLSQFYINDELLIEGDRIIIDGRTYSADEIKRVQVCGEFDEGLSVKTDLPYYGRTRGTCNKEINIDNSSREDKFGFGDIVVGAGEVIYGDVVALTGDVKVYGEVAGDVVAVFGDIELYDGARADGDVVAPFGQVIERGTVHIGGDMVPRSRLKVMGRTADVDFDISARYNRVEGLALLSGIKYEDYEHELPDFHFDLGYAFALKKWDLNGGFRQQFGDNWAFYFGANAFQGAVTPDEWMFTTHENTIATLFFKEDFHDFYYRRGARAFIGQEIGRDGYIEAEYVAQKNETLTRNTNKAIFGGKKNFRDNYSTVEQIPGALESIAGNRRQLAFTLGWDSRDDELWPRLGQMVELRWESAGNDGIIGGLGGDRSYDLIKATFTNYLPLNRKQHVAIRLKAGYSDDNLPLDKWFFLGGPGSLRGYDYKEFYGNRYFMANLDYYFEFSHDFALAVFGDLGKAGFSESQYNSRDYKNDIGIGLAFRDAFRLDIAQRLDNSSAEPVVMARSLIQF